MTDDKDIVPTYEELIDAYENGGGIRITHPNKVARHHEGLIAVYGYAVHRVLRFLRGHKVASVSGAPGATC